MDFYEILFAAASGNPLMHLASCRKPFMIALAAFGILLKQQELSLRTPAAFGETGIIG
jgi:hypothetical protein